MPAIDINAWMVELLGQLSHNRQRQLVVLQGSESWCDAHFSALAQLPADMLVLSSRALGVDPIPLRKADSCLGREASLVVLDLLAGFDPDLLCIAAGLVRAGGALVVLSPAAEDWASQSDCYANWQGLARSVRPRFAEYFVAALQADTGAGKLITTASVPEPQIDLPPLQPSLFANGMTQEQAHCLQRIEHWLGCGDSGLALLSADRGRGKSSCLGLLLRRLPAGFRVLVCAASRQTAAALLQWTPDAEFVAPDQLLLSAPPADLVIIDEAAMIPQSLLRQITALYRRLLMATTTGGYEGTGRGFMLRFVADLNPQKLLRLEMQDPVRWCPGDHLETWLNRVLMLDCDSLAAASGPVDAQAACLQLVEKPACTEDLDMLLQVHRLLITAHYRTRPSDLRSLMENPDLALVVAHDAGRVIGAALLNREGGFDAELGEQVFLGRRRPKGHLLAQMLTAQAGIAHFAGYRGIRVQRIAVDESCRRQGLGTRLLQRVLQYARACNLDYVGASFALDARSAEFWQQAGFSLAHVSYAQGKSSGSHSVAVLAALRAGVADDLVQLQQRLQRQLPAWMTLFLQSLDTTQVTALLRMARFSTDLSELERREIEAFARGHKGFELCFVSLQQFIMQCVASSVNCPDRLLIEKAVQNKPWSRLERETGAEGRKQLQKRLRRLVDAELNAG